MVAVYTRIYRVFESLAWNVEVMEWNFKSYRCTLKFCVVSLLVTYT